MAAWICSRSGELNSIFLGYNRCGGYVKTTSSHAEILAQAQDYGIDLSLLRERLRWTPTERLERHQAALALAEALRHAKRKSWGTRRPASVDRPCAKLMSLL
jgi:hypothetical protein